MPTRYIASPSLDSQCFTNKTLNAKITKGLLDKFGEKRVVDTRKHFIAVPLLSRAILIQEYAAI